METINNSQATISLDFKLVDIFDMVIDETLGLAQLNQIVLTMMNNKSNEAVQLLAANDEFMSSLRGQLR